MMIAKLNHVTKSCINTNLDLGFSILWLRKRLVYEFKGTLHEIWSGTYVIFCTLRLRFNICSTPNFVQGPFNMILWLYEKYSLSKSCNKKLLKCLEVAKWVVIMCIRFINEKNTFSVFRRTVGLIRIFALKNTSYTHFSFIFSVFRRTVGRIRSLFWNILKSN